MIWDIKLSPQVSSLDYLSASVSGSTVTVQGEEYDLSLLEDGDILPPDAINNEFFPEPISRVGNTISLTLLMPIRRGAAESARFPAPVVMEADGVVPVPNGESVDEQN